MRAPPEAEGRASRPPRCHFVWLALCLQISIACQEAERADPGTAAVAERPPSILLVIADDVGYGDLGVYGHSFASTPHLDRLAAEGVRFTSLYAASPVCSPSRAALLTGRHPFRIPLEHALDPFEDRWLPAREVTLASWLRRKGYATAIFGKWHLAGRPLRADVPTPGQHGFDHWKIIHGNGYIENGVPKPTPDIPVSAEPLARDALAWLRSTVSAGPGAPPFFLVVSFHEAHVPYGRVASWSDPYAALTSEERARYYGSVSRMDAAVGHLLDGLETLGVAEHTLVFATSDNGPIPSVGSSGGLRGGKRSLHEGGLRVPALLRWPDGAMAGTVVDDVASHFDLFPTVAELAGAGLPADRILEGVSWAPLRRGEPLVRTRPLVWVHRGAPFAIRRGDWKLRSRFDGSDQQLYRISDDPAETRDLSRAEPERATALLAELQGELMAYRADAARCACPWAPAITPDGD